MDWFYLLLSSRSLAFRNYLRRICVYTICRPQNSRRIVYRITVGTMTQLLGALPAFNCMQLVRARTDGFSMRERTVSGTSSSQEKEVKVRFKIHTVKISKAEWRSWSLVLLVKDLQTGKCKSCRPISGIDGICRCPDDFHVSTTLRLSESNKTRVYSIILAKIEQQLQSDSAGTSRNKSPLIEKTLGETNIDLAKCISPRKHSASEMCLPLGNSGVSLLSTITCHRGSVPWIWRTGKPRTPSGSTAPPELEEDTELLDILGSDSTSEIFRDPSPRLCETSGSGSGSSERSCGSGTCTLDAQRVSPTIERFSNSSRSSWGCFTTSSHKQQLSPIPVLESLFESGGSLEGKSRGTPHSPPSIGSSPRRQVYAKFAFLGSSSSQRILTQQRQSRLKNTQLAIPTSDQAAVSCRRSFDVGMSRTASTDDHEGEGSKLRIISESGESDLDIYRPSASDPMHTRCEQYETDPTPATSRDQQTHPNAVEASFKQYTGKSSNRKPSLPSKFWRFTYLLFRRSLGKRTAGQAISNQTEVEQHHEEENINYVVHADNILSRIELLDTHERDSETDKADRFNIPRCRLCADRLGLVVREPFSNGSLKPQRVAEPLSKYSWKWLAEGCPLLDFSSLHAGALCPKRGMIRSDAVAMGFTNFDQDFQQNQILCIYGSDADHVSLMFFHVKGMARIIGVGLPFCEVKLGLDSVIVVKQIGERLWKSCWTEQARKKSSLLLFDYSELDHEDFSTIPRGSELSTQESADQMGVGVEGINVHAGERFQSKKCGSPDDVKPPDWIGSLYKALRSVGDSTEDDVTTEVTGLEKVRDVGDGNESGSDHEDSTYASIGSNRNSTVSPMFMKYVNPCFGSGSGDSNQELNSDSDAMKRILSQGEFLQLKVIIHLDPEDYKLFSPDKTELTIERCDTHPDSDLIKFTDPAAAASADSIRKTHVDEDPYINDYHMVPDVTIEFMFDPTLEGRRRKRLRTTLGINYLMDGSIEDYKKFGWYHDDLLQSFECDERNQVKRDYLDRKSEILSDVCERSIKTERGRDDSVASQRSNISEFKGCGGHRSVFWLGHTDSFQRETIVTEASKNHAHAESFHTCLHRQNFAITVAEKKNHQLAYRATGFPPFSNTSMWDVGERQKAQTTGMMSGVELKTQGNWIVTSKDDAQNPTSRLCNYRFLCQRSLIRYRLLQEKRSPSSGSTSRELRLSLREEDGQPIEKIQLQQRLERQFVINHSFSHMQNLRRSEPYDWEVSIEPSPVENLVR